MRHQWVFSLVTCLHQVSYHTFYQWVTYDWWEPRLLFSFICDLSEWTTGISRLLNSLNAWRQGLPVLIQAGSRVILFTSGWWEEGQEEKREAGRGEGRGNSFCEQRQLWLCWFLSPRKLCEGNSVFPDPEEADSWSPALEALRLWGWRGEALSSLPLVQVLFFRSVGQIYPWAIAVLWSHVEIRALNGKVCRYS